MNRNPKEKFARIDIRVNQKDKDKIKQLAEKCNLSISEYLVQRALGYEPITVLPDVFFDFYNKLCQLDNTARFTPETENKLLSLIDEIHTELLLPRMEKIAGAPQSLLCGEKEHPRSDESFGIYGESDKRSVM